MIIILIAIFGFVPILVYGLILVRRKWKKRNQSNDLPDNRRRLVVDGLELQNSPLFQSVLDNSWNPQSELWELKRYFIKDLELGRQIAMGSFSVVHIMKIKESVPRNHVIVAGKILHQMKDADFLREVILKLKASETCNNIVRVIGYVMQPKVILMEYHRNGSLAVALEKDHNLHDDRFILELSKAVRHLHKIGIVHRDLASRNLLLSDDQKRVLLGDFGLARRANMIHPDRNLTDTVTIPETSPPESWAESINRQVSFGLKTDVGSIATTIWEIVNKRPIGDCPTGMMRVIGTRAMIPKRFLREDIYIGESFTRENELWTMMRAYWFKIPKDRPQVWEVYETVRDFVKFPRGGKSSNYVADLDSYSSYGSEKELLGIKSYELMSSVTYSSIISDSSYRFGENVVTTKHHSFREEKKD